MRARAWIVLAFILGAAFIPTTLHAQSGPLYPSAYVINRQPPRGDQLGGMGCWVGALTAVTAVLVYSEIASPPGLTVIPLLGVAFVGGCIAGARIAAGLDGVPGR